MKKFKKKHVVLVLVATLIIISGLFLRKNAVKFFYYRTSTVCQGNLLYGDNVENFEYRIVGGGLAEYNKRKSDLESLNIPQSGCGAMGFEPADYTTLMLYLL